MVAGPGVWAAVVEVGTFCFGEEGEGRSEVFCNLLGSGVVAMIRRRSARADSMVSPAFEADVSALRVDVESFGSVIDLDCLSAVDGVASVSGAT